MLDSADCVFFCIYRWKNTNEDRSVFQDQYGGDPKKSFFAVYDGHHGHFAADIAATEFHNALLMEMQKFDPATQKGTEVELDKHDSYSRVLSSKHSATSMQSRESSIMLEQIVNSAREDQLKTELVNDDKVLTAKNNQSASRKKDEKSKKES